MPEREPPALRLTRWIKLATDKKNGKTINALAKAINGAYPYEDPRGTVRNRLLTRLRDNPQSVTLAYWQLIALNTYFKAQGLSLQQLPMLESRGVIEVMSEGKKVVFMLGVKPRPTEQRTDLSHWDRRSQSKLQTLLSRRGSQLEVHDEDVLWGTSVDPNDLRKESWYRILEQDEDSVISIGSPLAALSSEVMLARMFGVEPFERPRFTPVSRVPFYFVWLNRISAQFRSAFGLTWRELGGDRDKAGLAGRVRTNQATALLVGNTVHENPVKGREWTMYGIIAAQRRASGNVWLVVSGLHGPATYGAARVVERIVDELPCTPKKASDVLWAPVKVRVRAREPRATDGDIREIIPPITLGATRIWPVETRPSGN